VGAAGRAGREGPSAAGPVVAVADAGRITEVGFVPGRHQLTRLGARNKQENT